MTNYTYQINQIIKDNGIIKWQLAQRVGISQMRLTEQLRDGIKTGETTNKYYTELNNLLTIKEDKLKQAKHDIKQSQAELKKSMAE